MTNTKGNIMSIRSAYKRSPLLTQTLRTFDSLSLASDFIGRISVYSKGNYCFNIQQTAANRWVVSRVISGGVQ
ncbi:hypothetical protein [Snodgrassella alvi]|uniref:hypothetical protein n=1 Tax=Snodgrassella alvi TaxID=1196083 RepID=UPI003514AC8B